MRLYVNLDTLQLVAGPGIGKVVTTFEFKRGDAAQLRVQFLDNGSTPVKLAAGTVLTFVIKPTGVYDGAALVIDSAWTTPSAPTDFDYLCTPNFNTTELNTALGVGAAADVASITANGEISWQVGAGAPTSTKTFTALIHNDLYRGNEAVAIPAVPEYPPAGSVLTTGDIGATVAAKAHSHEAAELPATMPPSTHTHAIQAITGVLTAVGSPVWAEIAAGAEGSANLEVTGAVTTNTPTVALGWGAGLEAGLVLKQARVSAADTISITLRNLTAAPITPAAVQVRAVVLQFPA